MTSPARLAFLLIFLAAGTALTMERVRAGGEHYFPPVSDAKTAQECGSCHLAYPAAMLPAASWQRLMGDLSNHFGDDASVDAATREQITRYLVDNAGDRAGSPWGRKLLRGVEAGSAPLRITELPRWVREHREVPQRDWSSAKVKTKANCAACHTGADKGYFDEE